MLRPGHAAPEQSVEQPCENHGVGDVGQKNRPGKSRGVRSATRCATISSGWADCLMLAQFRVHVRMK